MTTAGFAAWLDDLQARHLADLRFSEVTRAVRALSAGYVQRRARLGERRALDTAGKRAAYALYYSPLHYLTVSAIVHHLDAGLPPKTTLLDLGCGAGAAGAAWAAGAEVPAIVAIDALPWALEEAAHTYRAFGLAHRTRRGDAATIAVPRPVRAIVAGWMINELDERARAAVRAKLWEAARAGTALLVVEPIATRVSPWWPEWADEFARHGGRADQWRLPVELPDLLQQFDRATGMDHRELTARSLFLRGRARGGY